MCYNIKAFKIEQNEVKDLDNETKSRRQLRAEEKVKKEKTKKIGIVVGTLAVVAIIIGISIFFFNQYNEDNEFRQQVKLAKSGDAQAQYELGMTYFKKNTKEDDTKALEWLEKSAEQGNLAAKFQLGTMYSIGDGVEKDLDKSVEYLEDSANGGYAEAQYYLGYSYYFGISHEQDVNLGIQWIEKAAKQGYSEAMFALAYAYQRTEPPEEQKAFEWLLKAANEGSYKVPEAQYEVAMRYLEGEGTEVNVDKAMEYLEKAASQDLREAQYQLGTIYKLGKLVEANLEKGIEYISKAAENNYPPAQYDMALMYKDGNEFVKKDENKATELMEAAASQDYTLAKQYLGIEDETETN